MSPTRYALYLTPPLGGDLWRFGCDVIGRDASSGEELAAFAPEGHTPDSWRALTEEPRRYGFHCTLIAPFRLRADLDVTHLVARVAAFAKGFRPFETGDLEVGAMAVADGRAFVALKPAARSAELHALEEAAVRQLDALRAPLTDAERRKRDSARLTPLQRYYLDAWGYPYVLNEFRPHFTLTNALADARPIVRALSWDFQMRVASPRLKIEALTLFGERGGAFEILRQFPLGAARQTHAAARRPAKAAALD